MVSSIAGGWAVFSEIAGRATLLPASWSRFLVDAELVYPR